MRRRLRRIPTASTSQPQLQEREGELGGRPRADVFPVRTPAPDRLSRVVVDAAVVSKWFVSEPNSEPARRIVELGCEVVVPDLVFSDLGTILQRRVASNEMSDSEALSIVEVLSKMPLQVHRTWPLGPIALELQRSLTCTVYECLHIALALRESAVLVTADRKLYDMLRPTPLARYVCWITDFAPSFIS